MCFPKNYRLYAMRVRCLIVAEGFTADEVDAHADDISAAFNDRTTPEDCALDIIALL